MLKSKLIINLFIILLLNLSSCLPDRQRREEPQSPCRMQCRLITNQNTTKSQQSNQALVQQTLQKCLSYCAYQQNQNSTLVTIIIVLIVLVLIASIILIAFCFYMRIKKNLALQVQFAKRRVIRTGTSEAHFKQRFSAFQNIFSEQQRAQWLFFYKVGQKRIELSWFNIETRQIAPFQNKVDLLGQDNFGQWTIDGYFVNTEKGLTFWGFKKYSGFEQRQNNSQINTIVFQIQQRPNGAFLGQWYFRGRQRSKGLSGEFKLVKKGMQQMINIEIYQNLDMPYQEASHSSL